ncbi:PIG-H domain-containing protein [Streptomyces laurentii]|uniref:PIG-H domain-containing protein n=1 Tax=Streptomyces laurentii TaxID=39478 RepID=A0A160P1A2_STRLU|nr:PIG-H domain-containing protein [Streptomyces laurentii]
MSATPREAEPIRISAYPWQRGLGFRLVAVQSGTVLPALARTTEVRRYVSVRARYVRSPGADRFPSGGLRARTSPGVR